ncbi:hypothetical protein [Burkholderia paludis]|uniref:hypothetical protein n=1 Tax=Burkholderia paludis TaxID=1506587 RepID=UPI000946B420|nr:hypothetical protein [Burkholderia paludis]
MKHGIAFRFATAGQQLRRTDRPRARGPAAAGRRRTASWVDARLAAMPVRAIASGRAAGRLPGRLASRRSATARAAASMPSPARHRPLSSVRLTLMQDHSS